MRRRWQVRAYHPRAIFGMLHPEGGRPIPDGVVSRHWLRSGARRSLHAVRELDMRQGIILVDYRVERVER